MLDPSLMKFLGEVIPALIVGIPAFLAWRDARKARIAVEANDLKTDAVADDVKQIGTLVNGSKTEMTKELKSLGERLIETTQQLGELKGVAGREMVIEAKEIAQARTESVAAPEPCPEDEDEKTGK